MVEIAKGNLNSTSIARLGKKIFEEQRQRQRNELVSRGKE